MQINFKMIEIKFRFMRLNVPVNYVWENSVQLLYKNEVREIIVFVNVINVYPLGIKRFHFK